MLTATNEFATVRAALDALGWIYRGAARERGGHVFVLESHPRHRVAHLHVVEHEGEQWRAYLGFRDLLQRSEGARRRYEDEKIRLTNDYAADGRAYTSGKSSVVSDLLGDSR